jgi:hypothetical protein
MLERVPGGDETEPTHSHLGCVRGVITQLRSCVNTEANIPIGVAGASRCGHYCLNGPRPPRNSAGVGRYCIDGDGLSWSQREGRLRVRLFKEEKP